MDKYSTPLDKDGWSKHYNLSQLTSVIDSIQTGNVSIWSEEMCRISKTDDKILEIGCGTGTTSLWLAKNGRKATALDYTDSAIALVKEAASRLKLDIETMQADATKELPFNINEFDILFQAGLLEHFSTQDQIKLLKSWKKYTKRMVSMIPNAASIPYRVGKDIMEKEGKWEYGLETPKHSLEMEFTEAGIKVEQEYTIGTKWALSFLPKRHYIRHFFEKMQGQGIDLDSMMQGYLLVTIGKCEK